MDATDRARLPAEQDQDGNARPGEHERAEAAPREDEARFRAIFERAALGIALADLEERLVESNPALQRMLGYSEDELRGMSFTEVTHPDDVAADAGLYGELVAGQRDYYQLEKRYIRKDGRVVWGHLTVSLIRDGGGESQFAIGMVEDITERKRVESELVEARRRLAESREAERLRLARDLHDSTVQALLGINYQLDESPRRAGQGQQGDELAPMLEAIRQEVLGVVTQLRGLIGELRPAGLEEFGLATALEGYVARLQRERRGKMPAIVLDLDPGGPELPRPVALRLFRVAQEALRNALRHARARQITLRLRLLPNEVALSVHDDGRGFTVPAHLGELAQADHFGVIGMAEQLAGVGGQLTIESQPGAGTVVTARIPVQAAGGDNGGADSHPAGR